MVVKKLWRAANDDYVSQGYSFAETRETAVAYLDNPGFGGARIFKTSVKYDADHLLDWTEYSLDQAVEDLGASHPGSIELDEWLPRTPSALDELRSRGFLWVIVAESFPEDTTTWIWLGNADDNEPVLKEARS